MRVGGGAVNHGLVLIVHHHIPVCKHPAGRLDTSFGSGGGGVGVEIVGVGEVAEGYAALLGTHGESEVVDVVATEVA